MNYEYFGVMIDCSRNGVMKPKQVMRFIDAIAKMGYNMLELYTEDTYEIEDEPYFGYLRGRYTGKELREIDEYAKSKGIEVIPCIQTLAHLPALRKNFPMNSLFDVADILLCDEEKTYEFLERCFASIAKNFTSRNMNIGMDEAHLLGLGAYLKKHGYTEKYEILSKHLTRVNEIAQKYGFTPHMWSDMFFRPITNGVYYGKGVRIPEDVKNRIPENVGLTYWDYRSQDKEQYDEMFISHKDTGRKVWYAGGAWCWLGFAPYNRFTLDCMKVSMQSVREQEVKNVIITAWGDHGKECSYFAILPSLYAIRKYADGVTDEAEIKKDFEETFGVAYDAFMALDLPNDVENPDWNGTGWPENPCKCLFYQDPFQGVYDEDYRENGEIPYGDYARKLYSLSRSAGEYDYIFKSMTELCYFLDVKAGLGIRVRDAYKAKDLSALEKIVGEFDLAIARLKRFYDAFYTLWHTENKAFGWEVQDIRLGGVERRLKSCKKLLQSYLAGEIDEIEELEAEIIVTGKLDMLECCFENIATKSNLN